MSWIFAAKGQLSEDDLKRFESLHPEPLYKISIEGLYIAAGSYSPTCKCSFSEDKSSGFVVSGVGIKCENQDYSYMDVTDWSRILGSDGLSFDSIEGHYTGIKWSADKVVVFNDPLGGRDMYISSVKNYTLISTRLDFIAALNRDVQLDFRETGSIFLIGNQLSTKSILSGTTRLGPDGRASIKNGSINISQTQWLPDFEGKSEKSSADILKKLTLFPIKQGYNISFCLSGGVDTRALLSQILAADNKYWEACTFGHPDHPDSVIARKIAADFNINHREFYREMPEADVIMNYLREFIPYILLSSPSSEFQNKRYFHDISKDNHVIMDGGFGEITRNGFFTNIYKIFFLGRLSNLKANSKNVNTVMDYNRLSFLSDEVVENIKSGLIAQFENIADTMPSPSKIGVVNWLDLIAVRYRYPNLYGGEQSRCDGIFLGHYPYTKKKFLEFVFGSPASQRLSGKLQKSFVYRDAPMLKKYPFVKNYSYIPYKLAPIPAKIWGKIKQRTGFSYHDSTLHDYLHNMKEPILDFVNSPETANSAFYNMQNLKEITQKYFNGEETYGSRLDLWLVIEVFRREFHL